MARELIIHLPFGASLIILVSLIKGWLTFSYWPFWVGGLVGTFFPYLDHFLYVFLLRPYELTSQRVILLFKQKRFSEALKLLRDTKAERKDLIVHSVYFQIIFIILTFWVLSSSGSLFGRGLVLTFYLHLVVDMYKDFQDEGGIERWFGKFGDMFNTQGRTYYLIAITLLLIFFAFFL